MRNSPNFDLCSRENSIKVRHWRNFARAKILIGEILRVRIFFVNRNDDGWVVMRPFVRIVTFAEKCKRSFQNERSSMMVIVKPTFVKELLKQRK